MCMSEEQIKRVPIEKKLNNGCCLFRIPLIQRSLYALKRGLSSYAPEEWIKRISMFSEKKFECVRLILRLV